MIIFVAGWKAIYNVCIKISRRVGMADEADSKSVVGNHVRVQVPLPAGIKIAEMLDFTSVSVFFFTQLL